MFVTKQDRITVYSYLFKEGTLVAKKDFYAVKHSDAIPVANLEVIKLMQSFKSRGYVTETFNWQYYYYYLTETGIAHLRQYLGLPDDIVPATLKKSASTGVRPTSRPNRYQDGEKGKNVGPSGSFQPEFRRERGERPAGGRDSYRRQAQ